MIYIFKMPDTPAEAIEELGKILKYAVHIMCPENRRKLYLKRNKVNAAYDKIGLLSNTLANQGDPAWIPVAEKAREDRKILVSVKEGLQEDAIQIY